MTFKVSRDEREGSEERKEDLNHHSSILNEEELGKAILDSAFKVHTVLGPGLLESVYEAAMAIELSKQGLIVERQKPIPLKYEGEQLDVAFRADLIVQNLVLVELKSVEAITPLFKKVTTNYLKLIPLRLGFLINFNEVHLKNGVARITNGLEGKNFFRNHVAEINLTKPSLTSPP